MITLDTMKVLGSAGYTVGLFLSEINPYLTAASALLAMTYTASKFIRDRKKDEQGEG